MELYALTYLIWGDCRTTSEAGSGESGRRVAEDMNR
jgi:hypothetical protein